MNKRRKQPHPPAPPAPKLRPGLALPFAEGGCVVLRVPWQKPPEPELRVWWATRLGPYKKKTVAVTVEDDRAVRYEEGK